MSESTQVKMAQELANIKENMPAILTHLQLKATMHKAKYNFLLKEGFTEAQALELCKDV